MKAASILVAGSFLVGLSTASPIPGPNQDFSCDIPGWGRLTFSGSTPIINDKCQCVDPSAHLDIIIDDMAGCWCPDDRTWLTTNQLSCPSSAPTTRTCSALPGSNSVPLDDPVIKGGQNTGDCTCVDPKATLLEMPGGSPGCVCDGGTLLSATVLKCPFKCTIMGYPFYFPVGNPYINEQCQCADATATLASKGAGQAGCKCPDGTWMTGSTCPAPVVQNFACSAGGTNAAFTSDNGVILQSCTCVDDTATLVPRQGTLGCKCPDGTTFLTKAAPKCPSLPPPPTCSGDSHWSATVGKCMCNNDGYWYSADEGGCQVCVGDPVNWMADPTNGETCICRDPNAQPGAGTNGGSCVCKYTGPKVDGKCPTKPAAVTCPVGQSNDPTNDQKCLCDDPHAEIKSGSTLCTCKDGWEWPVINVGKRTPTQSQQTCVQRTTQAPPTCESNQHIDGNKCVCNDENAEILTGSKVCSCKDGFELSGDAVGGTNPLTEGLGLPQVPPKCVVKSTAPTVTCKSNQHVDAGSCVCDDQNAHVDSVTKECQCNEHFNLGDDNICVADSQAPEDTTCPTHQHHDNTSNSCVCDDVNAHVDSDTGACRCNTDQGYHPDSDGVCVKDTTTPAQCGQYQSYQGSKCVCDDKNAHLVNGECVCKTGYSMVGTECTKDQKPPKENYPGTTKPNKDDYDNKKPPKDNDYQKPPKSNDYDNQKPQKTNYPGSKPPKSNDYDQKPPKSDDYNHQQPSKGNDYNKAPASNDYNQPPQLHCPSNAYLSSSKTTCICNCENSSYDAPSNKCVCKIGYTMKYDNCVKDTPPPTTNYSKGKAYDDSSSGKGKAYNHAAAEE